MRLMYCDREDELESELNVDNGEGIEEGKRKLTAKSYRKERRESRVAPAPWNQERSASRTNHDGQRKLLGAGRIGRKAGAHVDEDATSEEELPRRSCEELVEFEI